MAVTLYYVAREKKVRFVYQQIHITVIPRLKSDPANEFFV